MTRLPKLPPSYLRFGLWAALVVFTAAINGFLIANLLDLVPALVAIASLILVAAAGLVVMGSTDPPTEREEVKQPAAPARAPRSEISHSIALGALVTINVLFILAAALGATRVVVEGRRQEVLVRTPSAGQFVYRVWGDGPGPCQAQESGRSWTPVDPRSYGSGGYRVVAGLPDECNGGQYLTIGRLRSGTNVMITWAGRMSRGPKLAFCPYPGGLIEYRLEDVEAQVIRVATVELEPDFGGKPPSCPGEG